MPFTSADVYEMTMPQDFTLVRDQTPSQPVAFELSQNYPNPFNPVTTIKFSLDKSGHVKLEIFDLLGRSVAILIDKNLSSGNYETHWDGSRFSSGVYFIRLSTADRCVSKKMLMLK